MWNTPYMMQTFYIPHHFQYSNKLNQSNLSKMKTNIDQIVKLPKDVDLLTFKVLSENVVFRPGEKKHCPECSSVWNSNSGLCIFRDASTKSASCIGYQCIIIIIIIIIIFHHPRVNYVYRRPVAVRSIFTGCPKKNGILDCCYSRA